MQQHHHHRVSMGIGVVAVVITAVAEHGGIIHPQLRWAAIPVALIVAAITWAASMLDAPDSHAVIVYRVASCLMAGAWLAWTGGHLDMWSALGALVFVALAWILQRRAWPPHARLIAKANAAAIAAVAARPPIDLWYERFLHHCVGTPVGATVEPWPDPESGERVHVDLRPARGKVREQHIRDACAALAYALDLPDGCIPEVVRGGTQGQLAIDVPLKPMPVEATVDDDFSQASIYDEFTVMRTPRGGALNICLRSRSAVVAGAPDSGKTTALHRLILFFSRCTDAVVCVADTNGGGLAEPWMRPYAMRLVDNPPLGWVAANEAEALAMGCVLTAITKDRKHSPECINRRHGSGNAVLPVDSRLPLYMAINDEGGELRSATTIIGRAADTYFSKLAQIGRAEAIRVVKSVLRGSSDLLDKGMRVMCAIRICLRMEEEDEYGHVLGRIPAGVQNLILKGQAFLKTPELPGSVFGRTINVPLDLIERSVLATNLYRVDFDARAHQVAARLRPIHLLGREIDKDMMAQPGMAEVVRDLKAGTILTNRWARYERYLAAMRGEEVEEVEYAEIIEDAPAAPAAFGGAIGELTAQYAAPGETVPATEPEETPLRVREGILVALESGPLTSAEIGEQLADRGIKCARVYRQDVLKTLREAGDVRQEIENGPYELAG